MDFKKPVDELPTISTDLFVYLRKSKARTIGDAYSLIDKEATPEYLKKELLSVFGMKTFRPELLDGLHAINKAATILTSRSTALQERARAIRFEDLELGKEFCSWLKTLKVETLGEFSDLSPDILRCLRFPVKYLARINNILFRNGLPEKLMNEPKGGPEQT